MNNASPQFSDTPVQRDEQDEKQSLLSIDVVGTMRVTRIDGKTATPRSAKARALLGILALTPDHRRSRRWLESRLWSDRGEKQAQGSLRQALSDIRRSFGSEDFVLCSNREFVWLAEGLVSVDLSHRRAEAYAQLRSGRDLLEGLEVRDDMFEDWLRAERHHVLQSAPFGDLEPDRGDRPRLDRETCELRVHTGRDLGPSELEAMRLCTKILDGYFSVSVTIVTSSATAADPTTLSYLRANQ